MKKRPISNDMKPLYEKLTRICELIDKTIETISGNRFSFSIVIFSKEKECASIMVTNSTDIESTKIAMKEWLDAQDEKPPAKAT